MASDTVMATVMAAGGTDKVRAEVLAEITQVAAEQNRTLAPLTDELPLLDSGLDSLCLAVIVARLEDRMGFDPFTAAGDVACPVTVGDFVAMYESVAA